MINTTIICCTESGDPNWRWLEPNLADTGIKFELVRCIPRNAVEKYARGVNLARPRGCFEAVALAQKTGAKALVTFGPTLAMWCSLFARMRGLKIPILAHSFNFTELPPPLKRPMFAWTLQRIDRFLVFSNVERELYSKAFGLPVDRFDFVHWGVRRPEVENPDKPFVPGDYVCAIGGNARDYRTLIEAARRVPEVPFVLVVRPANLQGLDIPANVKVYTNLPFGRTMNVLAYSRFMLLPLVTSEVPCGHVTLVASMYLGKAYVITDSAGVRDYVHNGENALTVTVNSVDDLMAATRRLWADPALCRRLGENGLRFARSECTEERIEEHFRGWLKARNIVRP